MDIDREAPVVARAEIVIAATIDVVWAALTDVARWPTWRPDVQFAEVHGPLTAGSTFSRRTAGLDITSVVGELDPPHRIVWSGAAGGIVAVQAWTFEARPDGVVVHTEESWAGAPAAAEPDRMHTTLEGSLHAWLEQLRRVAEAPGRQPGY